MESQGIPSSQNNPEKEDLNWRIHTSQLQNLTTNLQQSAQCGSGTETVMQIDRTDRSVRKAQSGQQWALGQVDTHVRKD